MSKKLSLMNFAAADEAPSYIGQTSNNEYSFYGIRQEETVMESSILGTFARQRVRTVIVTVATSIAPALVADLLKNGLDGQIFIKEFTQSDLPEEVLAQGEDIYGRNVKRAGSDETAPICTKDGEPIYQFKVYMSAAQIASQPEEAVDKIVKHDNRDAIQQHRAAMQAALTKPKVTGAPTAGARKTGAHKSGLPVA